MKELLDDHNAVDDDGNVVPFTDFDQEAGAEWYVPPPYVPRAIDKMATLVASNQARIELQPTPETPVEPEWQRDVKTWARLGLDRFTPDDYTKEEFATADDYEKWQRVIRNFTNSLISHAKRIANAEGVVAYDPTSKLRKLYGTEIPPAELLEYAARIDEMYNYIIASGIIDQSLNEAMTKKKLDKAPDYEQVVIEKNDKGKLSLKEISNQKDAA